MRLGFVGLGTMGGGIARRLLAAGHSVSGYNRTASRAAQLVESGLELLPTPRDVAERSEITFSMVTNSDALKEIARGPHGIIAGLGRDKVYIDMSTVSPALSRELAAEVGQRGACMLDAPVSGSVSTLEEGRLSIMVGGDRTVFERVQRVLLDIGPKATWVGGNGQAALMKIATNLSLPVQMLAFSEAVMLAEKGGIRREDAVEVLLNSAMASPMLKYRGPFVLEMPKHAWFDVDMMQKDVLLALEAGRELNVPLPSTAVVNELLTAARGMGLAGQDFAVVFEVLARMAGVRIAETQEV